MRWVWARLAEHPRQLIDLTLFAPFLEEFVEDLGPLPLKIVCGFLAGLRDELNPLFHLRRAKVQELGDVVPVAVDRVELELGELAVLLSNGFLGRVAQRNLAELLPDGYHVCHLLHADHLVTAHILIAADFHDSTADLLFAWLFRVWVQDKAVFGSDLSLLAFD